MTKEQYQKHSDEYLKFEKVKNKTSNRADLHAFNLLDRLVPGKRDMISSAEHDEIWLDVDPEELSRVASEDEIIELIRCGVRYCARTDSLALLV